MFFCCCRTHQENTIYFLVWLKIDTSSHFGTHFLNYEVIITNSLVCVNITLNMNDTKHENFFISRIGTRGDKKREIQEKIVHVSRVDNTQTKTVYW